MKSYPSKLKQVNEKRGIGNILSMHERHANQRCGVNFAIKGPVLSLLLFSCIQEKNLNSNSNPLTRSVLLNQTLKKKSNKRKICFAERDFFLVPLPHLRIRLTSFLEKKQGDFLLQEKVKHPIITFSYSVSVLFFLCFPAVLPLCVLNNFSTEDYKFEAPHQRITDAENHTQH